MEWRSLIAVFARSSAKKGKMIPTAATHLPFIHWSCWIFFGYRAFFSFCLERRRDVLGYPKEERDMSLREE